METDDAIPDDAELAELCVHADPRVRRLAAEVRRLRAGIRAHQAHSGHSLCWLNDVELWKLIDAGAVYPHDTLPVRDEFLANCRRFYEARLAGTPWQDPPVRKTVVDPD